MNISQAINRLEELKFNTYKQNEKVEWLSRLDTMVKQQIIDTHDGAENVIFSGYDQNTPMDTKLLVPAPYDEMYLRWMEAQIDYHNGEMANYNNAIILFNNAFENYAAYYNREHRPVSRGKRFLF